MSTPELVKAYVEQHPPKFQLDAFIKFLERVPYGTPPIQVAHCLLDSKLELSDKAKRVCMQFIATATKDAHMAQLACKQAFGNEFLDLFTPEQAERNSFIRGLLKLRA